VVLLLWLQKKYQEMKESYEFLEAEKDSYEETIHELEAKVSCMTEQPQHDKDLK